MIWPFSEIEIVARVHHRLVWIHPYENGGHVADEFNFSLLEDYIIPKQPEELEFWQSRHHRVGAVEAAHSYSMGDANGFKSGDGGEAKNQFFRLFGYITHLATYRSHRRFAMV